MNYYAATVNEAVGQPELEGEIAADVCVVGAGIAGCSTALHLAARGYRVVVLEAQRVGWGASGRSGGQALPGYACSQTSLERAVGAVAAGALWDVSVEAMALLRARVAQHGIRCDLRSGQVQVAVNGRQRQELLKLQRQLEDGYRYRSLQFLDEKELREQVRSERYVAGLLDSAGGHLHPLNYTLGLAEAARAAGALFFEHSPVLSIAKGDPATVVTARGRVRAEFVVLCCAAYIGELGESLRRGASRSIQDGTQSVQSSIWPQGRPRLSARIMPVGTYMAATEVLGEDRVRSLIPNDLAVTDSNFVLDYFRRSADHRLLFGGRVSYSGLDLSPTGAATRRRMVRVFPQLRAATIEYAWGGYVDISLNRAPDFGRLRANVYYLQGFSGHGIALAGMAGKIVAEAIGGQAERFDLFARIPHRNFVGGRWLRMPALVLAMLWYRMKDLL